jgi:hypothetical protein
VQDKNTYSMYPVPLARAIQMMDSDSAPFRQVHRLIDAFEVLVKLHTAVLLSHFAEQSELDERIKSLLAEGLRTPSLGIWWQFAREIVKMNVGQQVDEFLPGLHAGLQKKGQLFRAMEGQDGVIAFRNKYAHGATPPDSNCIEDYIRYRPLFDLLVQKADYLRTTSWITVLEDGVVEIAGKTSPADGLNLPAEAKPGYCYVTGHTPGVYLSLHPLLTCQTQTRLHFFYNDLKGKRAASFLNYHECKHMRDEKLREELLVRIPIDEWKKTVSGVEEFKDRIEALTEIFKGRQNDLCKIVKLLDKDSGYLMLWGAPGIGKSAVIARAVQILGWSKDVRTQTYPELPELDKQTTVISYFIRRGLGSDNTDYFLRNLNQRIESKFRTGIAFSAASSEMGMELEKRLNAVSRQLGSNQRLLLCIDGLDEGSDVSGLLESIPKEAPEGILFLLSSRENPRVSEIVFDNIRPELSRSQFSLKGLSQDDIRGMLYEYVNKYEIDSNYIEQLATTSEGNPLYLQLLCDGLIEGDYTLNKATQLPQKMDDIYKNLLKRFGRTESTLDLLCLLSAAKDYLSPVMMASLLEMDLGKLVSGPLNKSLEVLYENPMTSHLDDYQLFHESLREYIKLHYNTEVLRWEKRLAEWSLGWEDLIGEMKTYALRHGVTHLVDQHNRLLDEGGKAKDLFVTICNLVDREDYREAIFRHCGNDGPLRMALRKAQRLLVDYDKNGSELKRIVHYALLLHSEGHRLYNNQLKAIDRAGKNGQAKELDKLSDLSRMGQTPALRVMLILRAIWARRQTGKLPSSLEDYAKIALEDASDPILTEFWELSLSR